MNDTERIAYDHARDEIAGLLDETRIHLDDAVDALRRAARLSRAAGFPYWLHGQIDAYTVPTLESFNADDTRQPGSVGSFMRCFDDPDAADYIPAADEIDDDDVDA